MELFALLYVATALAIAGLVVAAIWRSMRALEAIAERMGRIEAYLRDRSR